MKTKDRIFSLIEVFINCVKFHGLYNACIILCNYLYCKYFLKSTSGVYKFLNFQIEYLDKASLCDLFFEHFGFNSYFFKSESSSPVILDVGANIGDTIIYFKWLYPSSTIYAFEPHPDAYKVLKNNIRINSFKNIYAYNTAVGSQKKTSKLYDKEDNRFVSSSQESDRLNKLNFHEISINTLGSYLPIRKISKIDLLKIDIEGNEGDLLSNLDSILNKTQKVILEYHLINDLKKNSIDMIISKLRDSGFSPCIAGFYRNDRNFTNNFVSLIIADRITK